MLAVSQVWWAPLICTNRFLLGQMDLEIIFVALNGKVGSSFLQFFTCDICLEESYLEIFEWNIARFILCAIILDLSIYIVNEDISDASMTFLAHRGIFVDLFPN